LHRWHTATPSAVVPFCCGAWLGLGLGLLLGLGVGSRSRLANPNPKPFCCGAFFLAAVHAAQRERSGKPCG
jgi:hypothetical protein